jgi:hypothetical protein
MAKPPDSQGLAIFARVVSFTLSPRRRRSFSEIAEIMQALRGAHPMVAEGGLNEDAL